MKANRKFLREESAVSPVIAVILMVAITVVLSATVYVWVSGFGKGGEETRTMALSGNGVADAGIATLTVTSVTNGFAWKDIRFLVDGAIVSMPAGISTTDACAAPAAADQLVVCSDGTLVVKSEFAEAGQQVQVQGARGGTIQIVDLQANSVVFETTIL